MQPLYFTVQLGKASIKKCKKLIESRNPQQISGTIHFELELLLRSITDEFLTEIVIAALTMALHQRRPEDGVIHHSDQGCQYTSIGFGLRCKDAGVRPSMGSVGDCYDNAMCESFFATLECELLSRRRFRTREQARMEVFEFLEGWYNPHRRHSSLDYLSPMQYERVHHQLAAG